MFDHDDLKWLAANATELNRILQQVSLYSVRARQEKGEGNHLDLLSEQVEQASRISQALFDRITSRILTGAGGQAKIAAPPPGTASSAVAPSRTDISVKMPVGEVATGTEKAGDPPIRNPKGERELILLVDDDKDILERTGEVLDFEDYRVIVAEDGLEALRIYRQLGKKISLIILDYFLPVMDGDAVFDELKAIDPNVRVVLSSGFGEQAKLGSMLARGLCGFIPKPYTHEKLIGQIRLILDA